ncbi:biliverdin-producing heme oxygenase [Massilia sp. RP-1-19]|uniref:Biliverdin-producing heme oxygenase n=1 Tax=Massilia polaris TaxID=2728846 RepID=A0A848HUM1_9BURK|nr:biliverdin-producing heme oxygenase [Massilia polaris]NML63391.1 biliverdin-producing heme oxygenase [Massilia polaris]
MQSPLSLQVRAPDATATRTHARLSVRLREETRLEHKSVEAACGLPGAVRHLSDYSSCLLDFYGIFSPIERHIATFTECSYLGLSMQKRARVPYLQQDLRLLNVDPDSWREAPAQALPALPQFAFALGALYVLEGSTLGGQIIMSALQAQLRIPVDIPGGFFAGRGEQTGPLWNEFRDALDVYGQQYPEASADVIVGAKRTFDAIGNWFNENNNRFSS